MAKKKQRKKRTKAYMGPDAATHTSTTPTVTRIKAPNRNKLNQWAHDHKPTLIARAVQAGIISTVGLIGLGVYSLIF